MKNDEILITGATGFIGQVLVNDLINLGYKNLKVVSRKMSNLNIFKDEDVIKLEGDITDGEFLTTVINENTVVFHLAAMIDIKSKKDKRIYDVNYLGTKKLIDVCLKNKAKKLIYSSSSSVILPPKKGIIYEPSNFYPNKLIGDYPKSKAMASDYFLAKTKEDLNGVILYPTAVVGPYDNKISEVTEVLVDYYNKKRFFIIKGSYNFVDVRDVSKALINSYLYGKKGSSYIISGNYVTLDKMFKVLSKLTGKKKPIKVPLFLVRLVLPFLELSYRLRGKTPIFSKTSLKVLNSNSHFSCQKAKNEINYQARSLEESFKDTYKWLKEENIIK